MKRICVGCDNEIPSDKYSNAIYCSTICACRASGKRWREKNREYLKEKANQYSNNIAQRMLIRARSRAKLVGIPFNLTIEDIVIPQFCPILGIELVSRQTKGYGPSSPSLDRIIPKLGYIKGNVRVISARANLLKNDASIEELERVIADLKEIMRCNE